MKLQQKGHSSEHVEQTLEECKEKGYIREERYRDSVIRRLLKKNQSDWHIQQQLEREGIPISQEHIEDMREELQLNPETQIQRLIAKKVALLSPNDPKSEEKVLRHLFSRGYSLDQSREGWERFQWGVDNLKNTV